MTKYDKLKITAIRLINQHGFINLTRQRLCSAAKIPEGSFNRIVGSTFTHFKNSLTECITDDNRIRVRKHSRIHPKIRKGILITAAVEVAVKKGYLNMTRQHIAKHANVSAALISNYLGSMVQIRKLVLQEAVKREIPQLIAQGLVNKNKFIIKNTPVTLKKQALNKLTEV